MPAERMTAGEKQWTASNTNFEGGMGIDATVPFGYESDFLRPVYPVDRVKPEDFFSKKDIENARSRMVRWVQSLARSRRRTRVSEEGVCALIAVPTPRRLVLKA